MDDLTGLALAVLLIVVAVKVTDKQKVDAAIARDKANYVPVNQRSYTTPGGLGY